ncbi:MAG: hypothetical protein L0H53_15260 [Candidatus Nitrosocosmicus sp.]|nr:hypothetical protein [Candidatus Nitrosocosmicus sp.]MDN5868738.1 hypothetical protein [Candidatus Nitrosocosmicus sp.]
MSNTACDTDSIIIWKNDYTFEIDITLSLRKAGIDSIAGYGDELAIGL